MPAASAAIVSHKVDISNGDEAVHMNGNYSAGEPSTSGKVHGPLLQLGLCLTLLYLYRLRMQRAVMQRHVLLLLCAASGLAPPVYSRLTLVAHR